MPRTELARKPRSDREIHSRFCARLCAIDGKFALTKLLPLCREIESIAIGICNAVLHGGLKGLISNLRCELNRLCTIDVQQIAQCRKVHLIGILRTDKFLPCIREFYGGAKDINARLCPGAVKRCHILQMRVVFIHGVALNINLLECFRRVPIRRDHLILQFFTSTLRRKARGTRADFAGFDTRLVRAAAVKRKTRRQIHAVARLCALILCLARTQRIARRHRDAVLSACLLQRGVCRPLALIRDTQSRVRSKRRIDRLFERKAHRIRRHRKEECRTQGECGKHPAAARPVPLIVHKGLLLGNQKYIHNNAPMLTQGR